MKKLILAISLSSIVFFANAKAGKSSRSYESPHGLGFRIGLTTPTYYGGADSPSGYTRGLTPGFMAGLIYSYYFSEVFSIQPELLYIQGGYSLRGERTSSGTTYMNTTNANWGYVQIPILAKLRFGSNAFKFTLHAGPYIGIGTGGRIRTKSDAGTSSITSEYDLMVQKNGLATIDLGAAFGAGVNIKAGHGQIIVDLRFNVGFTDIYNIDPVPAGYKASFNFIPSLSIGYLYAFGK